MIIMTCNVRLSHSRFDTSSTRTCKYPVHVVDPMITCIAMFRCPAVVSVSDKQAVNPDDGDRSDAAEADRAETEGCDQLTASDSGQYSCSERTV